ncbi:MAG: histidine phosphatase family protein [Deltaproteobacteria bacterium]|nr:histidine phosphatase family protein [Deltaproteobacteria bacterium]
MKSRYWILVCALGMAVSAPAAAKTTNKNAPNSNELISVTQLTGTYYGLRHGESVPSSEKRICATMESGTDPKNGLTPKGREEVITSTTEWVKANKKQISEYIKQDKLVIVTSPFSRTKETADIFADVLQANFKSSLPKKYKKLGFQNSIVVDDRLRERNFGKFEGQAGNSGKIYDQVWAEDTKNPNQTKNGVESTASVQERASQVIADLEKQSQAAGGKMFILVAHGDTLKILQTAFQKQSPSEHCNKESVAPFKTAEIRQFSLAGAPMQAKK